MVSFSVRAVVGCERSRQNPKAATAKANSPAPIQIQRFDGEAVVTTPDEDVTAGTLALEIGVVPDMGRGVE